MRAARVAHCILEPQYGGVELLVSGIVRSMIADGKSVAIFSLKPPQPSFQPELDQLQKLGCALYLPTKKLTKLQWLLWILKCVREFKPDLLFAHMFYVSLFCRIALSPFKKPIIATVLHMDNELDGSKAQKLEKLLRKRSAIVVGVSPASLRKYQAIIDRKQQTRLITNGIEIDIFRSASAHRDESRSRLYKAYPGEVILLQIGRLSPEKQQLLTVQAIAELSKTTPLDNIRLVFVGSSANSEYESEVKSAAAAISGPQQRIEFMGAQSDIPLLLTGADIFLMPSAWESQGIAAMEALTCGIACILTPLEAFASYRNWPGVYTLPQNYTFENYAVLLGEILNSGAYHQRFNHDMSLYSFSQTSSSYLQLTNQLLGHGGL